MRTLTFGKRLLLFCLTVFLVTGVLAVLNWLPSLVQKQTMKKFSSIDAAEKQLRVKHLFLPTLIPEDLRIVWPPAEIYAQDVPFSAFIMHLKYKDSNGIGLVIQQTDADAPYQIEPLIKVKTVTAGSQIFIKDRKAVLVPAVCDDDIPCNEVSWNEGGTIITLICKCSAQEVVKIAASTLPEP
ncbi:MAG: hypothetical protein FIA94_03040 [Nitrospirae bacterium]|nr:hypothetical protein [Nitrospirota bacterium]